MPRIKHKQTEDGDGKITLSLEIKDWIGLLMAVGTALFFVFRTEETRRDFEEHSVKADTINAEQGRAINQHHWKIRRLERKTGIIKKIDREDD